MFTQLLKNKKLLAAIAALLVLALVYFLGRRKKGTSAIQRDAEKEKNENELTYQASQYLSYADRLEMAMQPLNDNEDAIYDVFSKMRNKSDVLYLIEAFGKRRQSYTIGKVGLNTFLNYQLNDSEREHINEILQRNDIDYKF